MKRQLTGSKRLLVVLSMVPIVLLAFTAPVGAEQVTCQVSDGDAQVEIVEGEGGALTILITGSTGTVECHVRPPVCDVVEVEGNIAYSIEGAIEVDVDRPLIRVSFGVVEGEGEGMILIACPPGEGPLMTGGGWVLGRTGVEDVRVTHGFILHCDPTAVPNSLQVNWGRGNKFHLEALTAATCSDDPTTDSGNPTSLFDTHVGTGTGRYNGVSGATAEWTLKDAGEPGREDSLSLLIKDANGLPVLVVAGTLEGGNYQAHTDGAES